MKSLGSRRLAYLLCTCTLALPLAVSPLAAQTATTRKAAEQRYDIPAGDAVTVLNGFAAQSGIQLLYPYDAVAKLRSPGLRGTYPRKEALRRLLRGLPLKIASDKQGVVTLRAAQRRAENVQASINQAPPAAVAEEADPEIVVVGSRMQFRQEISNRADNDAIVDTLSQDDTGDLADQSLAEALRRIPGVSTLYDEDEGSLITIRGAQPDWNHVTVDGLTLASVGTGGAGRRQVDIALIPGRIASRSEVFKTFNASLDAAAVGGVLNIVPRSAFDRKRPFLLVEGYANNFTYDDVPGESSMGGAKNSPWGGGFNLAYSGRHGAEDQFGLTVLAGYQQKQRDQTNPNTPTWAHFNDAGQATTPASADWNGIAVPTQFIVYDLTNRIRNYGGTVRFEWKPSRKFYSSIMAFAFDQSESETRNGQQFQNLDRPLDVTETSGNLRVRDYRIGYRYHTYDRATRGVQFHSQYKPNRRSEIDLRLGYSTSRYDDYSPNVAYSYAPNTRIAYDLSSPRPTFSVADPENYANPANFAVRNVSVMREDVDGRVFEAKLDYSNNAQSRDRGFGFQAGVNLRKFWLERDNEYENYRSNGSTLEGYTIQPAYTPIGWPYPVTWIDGARFIDEALSGFELNETSSAADSFLEDYRYDELILAGYAQARFATDDLTLMGGIRYDRAETNATIPLTLAGAAQPEMITTQGGYDSFLPSANLVYRLGDNIRLKASYSKTIGRPNPRDLARPQTRDDEELTITRGNPDLRPRRATNIDAAVEHYFNGGSGMLSLGVFDKQVSDDIFMLTRALEIDGLTYAVRQPINAESSSLRGIELNLVNERIDLGPLGDGLGVSLNATRLWGETVYLVGEDTVRANRQPSQSDWLANAAVFYSLPGGGEIRLAANYQGEYVQDFGAQAWLTEGWKEYLTFDLSVRHNLTKNIVVKFQARNFTDANRIGLIGDQLQYQRRELEFGRSFYFNFIYRM